MRTLTKIACCDSCAVYANLGQGFRAPNVIDLGTFRDRPGSRFNVPNPYLEPERLTSFAAGWKVMDDRLEGELIGFYSRYRDKITSVLTGDVADSVRLVVHSRNAARLVLYGAEFGGAATDFGFRRMARTTHVDSRRGIDSGRRLSGRPHPAAQWQRNGMTWRPATRWTLDGWLNFADRQDRYSPRDDSDPRNRPGSTPGWSTWNVRAAWEASEHAYASLQYVSFANRDGTPGD